MRAIGAGDGTLYRIVLVENLTVALISWVLGVALSLPLGWGLGRGIGESLLGSPPTFAPSVWGALAWLGLEAVLVLLSSWLPARRAVRLSVREALAYD